MNLLLKLSNTPWGPNHPSNSNKENIDDDLDGNAFKNSYYKIFTKFTHFDINVNVVDYQTSNMAVNMTMLVIDKLSFLLDYNSNIATNQKDVPS